MRMKAIILAAGEGRRLRPLTFDRPKAMLKIAGRTLIDRALDALRTAEIMDKEIIILSGHKAERLKELLPSCKFIHNDVYDSTNNIYSLWLGRKELANEEFILLNGDVLFPTRMVRDILEDERESLLIVDDINTLEEEEMRVMIDGKGRVTNISKTIDPDKSAGEYIGLAKFGREFSQGLFAEIDDLISKRQTNLWYENAIAKILDNYPIYSLSTLGLPWTEIDTYEDLAWATEIARKINKLEA